MNDHDFSGSYPVGDVRFLLKPIRVRDTPASEKDVLIQSGQIHYSEVLTHESLPSQQYLALFWEAVSQNQHKMATHLLMLAGVIKKTRPTGVTLVSLARAGTPIGVLLRRLLSEYFDADAPHYSISIIRDIGIDENALLYILHRHAAETLVFVDGWTGKGVIADELKISLAAFEKNCGIHIGPDLYVLADLAGAAAVAVSDEDYLIPSSILNATVSGLISRSVLDRSQLASSDFHGCHYYREYLDSDLSNRFVEMMMEEAARCVARHGLPETHSNIIDKERLIQRSQAFLSWVKQQYGISNRNLVKPGIGESTRVLLRRNADHLILERRGDEATAHLEFLATSKNIPIRYLADLPYRAAAVIKEKNR